MLDQFLIVIPARLHSRRLPRKPLQDLGGLPLIVQVYKNLEPLGKLGATIVVATDSTDVLKICKEHHVEVVMTRSDHQSGTDRCAEVAGAYQKPFVMNVQGDEPFVDLNDLKSLAKVFENNQNISMATLRYACQDHKKLFDPNVVKVVGDKNGKALYFSRSPIPFVRDKQNSDDFTFYQHLGIYAFEKQSLDRFCSFKAGYLETLEKLEQLRALEHGMDIILVDARQPGHGIDTPEDLQEARLMISRA